MRVHDFFENKIKGADGKACWDGYRYNGTKDGKDSCVKVTKEQVVDEARADVNFDAEDLKRLERISDLETLKTQAFGLISKPSAKPMKPEKVAWFKQALAGKSNKIAVIKMMYDLMLSGEGNSVIGSKNSMNPNSYRKVFNSATSEGMTENAEELGIGDDVIISGNVEFNGKTGVIDSFGQDKRFVVVNLYNHGKHSFHSSDVSVNDYADSDEEQARMSEAYQNDEANLWYIYDTKDGRLKQKMIDNLDEPKAQGMGYRDSIDSALRVANIIRSKFDAKKFVQKQGNQWVPVYPFGKPDVAEGESGMFSKVMGHETTPEAARQIQQQGFKKSHTGIFFNVGNQNYSGGGYGGTVVMAKVSGPIDDILNLEDDNDLPDNLDEFADGEEIANYAREEGYWAWTDGVQFAVLDPRHIQVVKQGVAEAELDPRLQRYMDNNPDEVSDSVDALRNRANAEGGRFKWAIGKLPDGRFLLGLQGNIKMLGLPVVDQGVSEAYSSPPPFKDMIASVYQPKVGDKIRTRKGGQIPGTVEKVADLKGIEYCWFRHPEGKLYKTPCSNVMRG